MRINRFAWLALAPVVYPLVLVLAQLPPEPSPPKPAPPPDEWQGTNFATAQGASVSSKGDPFDPSIHRTLTPQGRACSNALNAAIYRQDVLHAFESKAHFDNCAFEDSLDYASQRIAAATARLKLLRGQSTPDSLPPDLNEAMLALGQALHGIQDFYAHSNYVELIQRLSPSLGSESDLPILEIWKPAGRQRLLALRDEGLHSGRVWWSLPHRCSPQVPTHAKLAKDTSASSAGSIPSLFKNALTGQTISNHTVAFNLASRATREFLRWVGQNNPQVETFCGPSVRYIVQSDRRAQD